MVTIGERLEYALSLKNKKKGSLAKEIGVHASTIDNYIKNKVKNPSSLILEKIASCLDINPDWLILNIGSINDNFDKGNSVDEFKRLGVEKKLNIIYEMQIDIKKKQEFIIDVITEITKKDKRKESLIKLIKKEKLSNSLVKFIDTINNT
jgi:transcriptional regulator with XRE-family HTH domain